MHMPGFAAEVAVYRAHNSYRSVWVESHGSAQAAVTPQRGRGFPCSRCYGICAGAPTSRCDDWCACACRGGTHCGFPD